MNANERLKGKPKRVGSYLRSLRSSADKMLLIFHGKRSLRPVAYQRVQCDRGFAGVSLEGQQSRIGGERTGAEREIGRPVEPAGSIIGLRRRPCTIEFGGVVGERRALRPVALQVSHQAPHIVP